MKYLFLFELILTFTDGPIHKEKLYYYYVDAKTCYSQLEASIKALSSQPNVTINQANCQETSYREGEVPN